MILFLLGRAFWGFGGETGGLGVGVWFGGMLFGGEGQAWGRLSGGCELTGWVWGLQLGQCHKISEFERVSKVWEGILAHF